MSSAVEMSSQVDSHDELLVPDTDPQVESDSICTIGLVGMSLFLFVQLHSYIKVILMLVNHPFLMD